MGYIISAIGSIVTYIIERFVKKIAGATFRVGIMLSLSFVTFIFALTYFIGVTKIVLFIYEKINLIIEYSNTDSGDGFIQWFKQIITALGVLPAFNDVFTLFKPAFTGVIYLFSGKLFINMVEFVKRTITYLFIARID